MLRGARRTLLLFSVTLGCAGSDPGAESLGQVALGVDVCGETVPTDRNVDGIPSYSQCTDTMSANIWSNNGIDTSTASQGSDWIQTQRGGGYQCTELAYRYMHFRWQVDYRHGDAREWCDGDLPSNLVKSATPAHGDLIVFDGGACGADATTGHIAVVDVVDASGEKVTLVEENRAGRRSANTSCATCFLHAAANDGTSSGAGGGAGDGAGTASGGSAGGAFPAGGPAIGGRGPAVGGAGGGREPSEAGRGGVDLPGGAGMSAGGVSTESGGTPSVGQAGASNGTAAQGGASTGSGAPGALAGAPSQSAAGQAQAAAGSGATGQPGEPDATNALASSDAEGGCGIARRGHAPSNASLWGLLAVALGCRLRRREGARSQS